MPLLWVSLAISLETQTAALRASALATAALESPRPRMCRANASGENELWSRARTGDTERFCDLLAHGYARLSEAPNEALQAAEAAEAIHAAAPEVAVLRGRALFRSGNAPAAFEQFQRAERQLALRSFDPKTLHDYARAASLTGNSADAVRLYRVLVSRSALVAEEREKTALAVEAAAHVLSYAPNGSDEALGYLAQARRSALGLSPLIAGLRALIAVRTGASTRPLGTDSLPSASALVQAVTGPGDASVLLPPGELDAVRAVIAEPIDEGASRAAWQAFLDHARPDNIWLEQARKKRAEATPPRKANPR